MFSPPYIPPAQAAQSLRTHGYAVLQPEDFAQWMGLSVNDLQAMDADWQGLPPDAFLKDGGRYRRRRHSCFLSDGDHVRQRCHTARIGSLWSTTHCTAVCSACSIPCWMRLPIVRPGWR